MKVKCPNCDKVYNVPDERLPSGKKIALRCPACKGAIKVDLRTKSSQSERPSSETKQKEKENTSVPSMPAEKKRGSDEALKNRILKSMTDLPPMSQTVHKVFKIMSDPNSSFKELAKILETDAAIAAKVLKMANSSYYGLSGNVSSIQHASVVLGHETLGNLMTMAGTSGLLDDRLKGYGLEPGDLWRHSMAVAFGAKIIAKKKSPALADDAFAAGLIHDVGKLILDPYVFERKEAFQEFLAGDQQGFLDAEREILGFDHSEIASEVCKSWHIPEALSISIRYHHYPSESQGSELAYIVHIADWVAMMGGFATGIDGMLYQMDDKAMEFLDLKEKDMSKIKREVIESVRKIEEEKEEGS